MHHSITRRLLPLFLILCLWITPFYGQTQGTGNVPFKHILSDSVKSPSTPEISYTETGYSRVIWISVFFLMLLVAALWAVKRSAGARQWAANARVRVLARYNISPKQSILIVALEGKKIAIGATDSQINTLAELGTVSEDDLKENTTVKMSAFGDLLKKIVVK